MENWIYRIHGRAGEGSEGDGGGREGAVLVLTDAVLDRLGSQLISVTDKCE